MSRTQLGVAGGVTGGWGGAVMAATSASPPPPPATSVATFGLHLHVTGGPFLPRCLLWTSLPKPRPGFRSSDGSRELGRSCGDTGRARGHCAESGVRAEVGVGSQAPGIGGDSHVKSKTSFKPSGWGSVPHD